MISSAIRQLCVLSLLFGVALSVAPEGSVKRMMHIVSAVILICIVIEPIRNMDISEYALEIAKTRELEAKFLDDNMELSKRLNRLVIENECEAYIKDKAAAMDLELDPQVYARWNSDGLWVPYEIKLDCPENQEFSNIITAELGIPKERQEWQN